MGHLTDGTLRRLVDEPVAVTDADRDHAATCTMCAAGLASAEEDAAFAAAALGFGADDVDLDSAWRQLSDRIGDPDRNRSVVSAKRPSRWRKALRSPAMAAVGVVVVVAGAGTAAANDWFEVFRAEQVAPIAVTPADIASLDDLPDLGEYGDLDVSQEVDVRNVPNATAAAAATGLETPQVTELPRGVAGEPVYQVVDQASAIFTFSAEKAAAAAAAAGEQAPPPPAGLDGSQFRLTAGPGVAAMWPSNSGIPALITARAVAPSVESSGVPYETARDYLLSMPGLSDDLADQLRRLSSDGSTLPIVVPTNQATTSTTEINGVPATVITSRDDSLSAVVWVADGIITAVAGTVDVDEVLAVARQLQ